MLADAVGDEAGGGSLEEQLSRIATELGISERGESETDNADEVKDEIHMNPIESKGPDEEGED